MLLTGFESYGGRSLNPAEQVVKRLAGTEIARHPGERAHAAGGLSRARPADHALIEETQPRAVICLGLWPGTPMLRLERIAVNIADFEIPDNVGLMARGPVVEGGAEAYRSTLPIHAIQDRLLDAGIPARLSASAGTFLCNALMYHALRVSAERAPAAPCGFIHLPYVPEQVSALLLQMREWAKVELHQRADLASMALEMQIEAVRIAIETTLEATLELMAGPILELRHVRKRFGATVPADDVSLAIEAGEFFTFLGPSGSGKSTLLRIVAGLERADAGQVLLRGRDVGEVPPWRRHLGMVFQQYANFPHMNVAQNVAYGLRRRGLSRAEIRARVAELLDLVGLAGFEERRRHPALRRRAAAGRDRPRARPAAGAPAARRAARRARREDPPRDAGRARPRSRRRPVPPSST